MRTRSLSKSIGLMVAVTMIAACADEPETEVGEAPAVGEQPAVVAPTGGAPSATTSPGAAPAAAGGALPAGVTPAMVEEGRQIYVGQGLCFTCHGQEAQGTPLAPNLNDGEWIWIENPGQDLQTELSTLIRTGVAQPRDHPAPMPPMGGAQLSEDQLNSVVAYVLSLNS